MEFFRQRFKRLTDLIGQLGLLKALVPAVAAKIFSAATSWIFLPLAAIKLGPECYGSYALFLSLLSLLNIVDSGMGSGIVRIVANSKTREPSFLWSIFNEGRKFYANIAIALVAVSWVVIYIGKQGQHGLLATAALMAATFIVGFQVALSPVARVYAGAGLIHKWNRYSVWTNLLFLFITVLSGTVSNSFGLVTLIIGHALCIMGLPLFAALVLQEEVKGNSDQFIKIDVAPTLKREASSQLPVILAGVLQREFPKWGILLPFAAADLGRLSLLLTVLTGIGGLVAMFTGVIWPKITTALGNADYGQARRIRSFLYLIYACFMATLSAGVLFVVLHFGNNVQLGGFKYSNYSLLLWSVFSALILWEHIHFVMLMALDRLRVFAVFSIVQAFASLLIWYFTPTIDPLNKYLESQIVALLLCSAWSMPYWVERELSRK